MKESIGESSMTIMTIIIISVALGLLIPIILTLAANQSKRAKCENAGYSYYNGSCHNESGVECTLNANDECE